jgi:hypothetical protein
VETVHCSWPKPDRVGQSTDCQCQSIALPRTLSARRGMVCATTSTHLCIINLIISARSLLKFHQPEGSSHNLDHQSHLRPQHCPNVPHDLVPEHFIWNTALLATLRKLGQL